MFLLKVTLIFHISLNKIKLVIEVVKLIQIKLIK